VGLRAVARQGRLSPVARAIFPTAPTRAVRVSYPRAAPVSGSSPSPVADVTSGVRSRQPSDDGLAPRIAAIGAEYGFPEPAARALETLARWYDWDRGNFVPACVPDHPEPRHPLSAETALKVGNAIREAVAPLGLEPVRRARRAADIGSGVGYPALLLAVVLPQVQMTLIEPGEAKCGFLRRAIVALGLAHVEVEQLTVEEWGRRAVRPRHLPRRRPPR
jgi:hypothetical protein